jgi:general secretion pathway protein D
MKDFLGNSGAVLAVLLALSAAGQGRDPTGVAAPVADVLKTQLESFRAVELMGLVCAGPTNGVALVKPDGAPPIVARAGTDFMLSAGGIPFRVRVTGVTDQGVGLAAEGLEEDILLPAAFSGKPAPAAAEGGAAGGRLSYVEFDQTPLKLALRMLADQSDGNYVCTEEASKTAVSLFLRDVTPTEVVEELCKSHALWFSDKAEGHGAMRVLTMKEFQSNLASFQQEELSETFTLLYPNVIEVASIVQGLYSDRVLLSLGDDDILDDDLNDLSRRFERFNTVNNASSSELMGDFSLQGTYSAGGRRSARQSGVYALNNRNGTVDQVAQSNGKLRALNPDDASKIQRALQSPTNKVADVLGNYRSQLPLVYVTVSRRNNMLIVRTSDPRVMDDIRSLVKRVDQPTPMVLLDVKLLELTLSDDLNTVFDYTLNGDFTVNGGHKTDWNGAYKADTTLEKAMSFQLVNDHFTSRIQALQERGDAKVVATPSLLTANNEVSQLFIGKEIPITRNVSSQTVVSDNNVVTSPQTDIEFKRVGTLLLVTPSINADRTVTLRLLQQNSEVAADKSSIPVLNSTSGEVQEVPVDVIESRSVSGTFVAKDEMAIAVGGLIREKESDTKSGIPVLMDIPYLGWFFRRTEKTKSRTELLILITPHVISTPSESGAATQQFLKDNTHNPAANKFLPAADRVPEIKYQKSREVHLEP